MLRGLLLIIVFLLCAWIMRIFVRLVDRFIARSILPEDCREYDKLEKSEVRKLSEEEFRVYEGAPDAEQCLLENTMPSTDFFHRLLDKIRRKSKVRHNSSENTVQIGTARPTQIRIRHYE